MRPGIAYKQGTIVLVPFPFTDLTGRKRRPALIISPDWYNNNYSDVVLSAITSFIPEDSLKQDNIICKISSEDMETGKMPLKSIVKITKIFTCEKTIIEKSVAQLKKPKISEVLEKLKRFFCC